MQRLKPRQVPVSCELCRAKKLKCNREQPCSNCIARGVTCQGGFVGRGDGKQQSTETPNILERLERLESIVLQQNRVQLTTLNDDGPPSKRAHGQEPRISLQGSLNLFVPSRPLSVPSYSESTLTLDSADTATTVGDVDQGRDQDSIALENVGTREDSLLICLSNDVIFNLRSIASILASNVNPTSPLRRAGIVVPLPEYPEAMQLLRIYETSVDHFVRILHIPTMISLLGNFYGRLRGGLRVRPSEAALFLSIFAIAAFFSPPPGSHGTNSFLANNDDLLNLSIIFSKAALDVIEYSRRTTSGSIEDVQACILMGFVVYHLDGFSARGRSLSSAAVVIARDLRLHRVDDGDAVPDRDLNTEAMVEREVRRRVWWHITATDWLLSAFGGPQENSYFIQPKHMQVKLPRNCLDEDVGTKPSNYQMPLSEPSTMSYFLHRIRLAELCREIVESLPFPSLKVSHLRYEEVLALDRKLEVFLAELPLFLRIDLDPRSREKVAESETEHRYLPGLRHFINAAALSRRCKLHQPFLIRQSVDQRYVYSRKVCLESARAVIRSQQALQSVVPSPCVRAHQGLSAVIHFMHLSVVVLVMDLCFNKDQADQTQQRAEVKAAFKILEDVAEISPLPGRLLRSLVGTLQKYKVQLPEQAASNGTQSASPSFGSISRDDPTRSADPTTPVLAQLVEPSSMLDPSFEEFWQSAFQDPSLDTPQWDHLFTDIDSTALT